MLTVIPKTKTKSNDMLESGTQEDTPQPLVAHLTELRDRLLKSLLAILIIFIALFSFSSEIYSFAAAPLQAFFPDNASMIATEVASPFLAPFKLTLVLSVILAIPFLLHQLWSFVAPGLYRNEKILAGGLLASSIVLFYAGLAFAYFVVFPIIFGFFTSVAPEGVTVMTDINHYLNFILKLLFAFGIAFEIPVATILLIKAGITTPEQLGKNRSYVVVGCFVIGMLLTPPDVISQTLLALPVWLLFESGVFFGKILIKTPKAETEAQ